MLSAFVPEPLTADAPTGVTTNGLLPAVLVLVAETEATLPEPGEKYPQSEPATEGNTAVENRLDVPVNVAAFAVRPSARKLMMLRVGFMVVQEWEAFASAVPDGLARLQHETRKG